MDDAASIASRLNARLGLKSVEPPPEPPRTVVSQRYTTSSRHPGAVNDRPVRVRGSRIVVCRDCGRLMLDVVQQGAHSAHYGVLDGRPSLLNCVERPV